MIVAAGAAAVPTPLLDQLKPGGRLVMPIGPSTFQEQIVVITKRTDGRVDRCSLGRASFVPLTGAGKTPVGTHGLYDRTIPLCYGAPVTG
ncbi:protein-L-isoaspartate O-methyltransferase [uncultured Sphingomonas sp.]|uniref:protein-L-isoaspartate O-methyltransferase family protein n=1 Tax=uncultured Sphingomonas sp. TaxID=158754 RepID=UPI0035CA4E59